MCSLCQHCLCNEVVACYTISIKQKLDTPALLFLPLWRRRHFYLEAPCVTSHTKKTASGKDSSTAHGGIAFSPGAMLLQHYSTIKQHYFLSSAPCVQAVGNVLPRNIAVPPCEQDLQVATLHLDT